MGRRVRRIILRLMMPIARRFADKTGSRLHFPDDFYMRFIQLVKPGDVILTRTDKSLTNILIPGKYKHAAMYVHPEFVEASYPSVRLIGLANMLQKSNHICVVRPRGFNQLQVNDAINNMRNLVGLPYDFMFEPGEKAFYCSEAITYSYQMANKEFSFVKRSILGVDTVIPDDFRTAGQFKIILES